MALNPVFFRPAMHSASHIQPHCDVGRAESMPILQVMRQAQRVTVISPSDIVSNFHSRRFGECGNFWRTSKNVRRVTVFKFIDTLIFFFYVVGIKHRENKEQPLLQ